ncbi:MAG TPA: WGR domain-containing protein [Mesotoga infera]|nr:WGR domain-containing protein [Mesotoga infera]
MPSIYLEKVVPESNMRRFYFISDEHQTTFVGYPVTIIFGRISERAAFVTKVFPTEAMARRYLLRQLQLRQRHSYSVVKPRYLRGAGDSESVQLELFLF